MPLPLRVGLLETLWDFNLRLMSNRLLVEDALDMASRSKAPIPYDAQGPHRVLSDVGGPRMHSLPSALQLYKHKFISCDSEYRREAMMIVIVVLLVWMIVMLLSRMLSPTLVYSNSLCNVNGIASWTALYLCGILNWGDLLIFFTSSFTHNFTQEQMLSRVNGKTLECW